MSKSLQKKLGKLADKDENIPVFLIGQLGRSSEYDSKTVSGSQLFEHCYELIGSARDIIGGRLILIECKRIEKLCKFYEDKGYIDITENGDDLKQYIRLIK